DLLTLRDRALQKIIAGKNVDNPRPLMDCWLDWPHIHGTPTYGEFADGSAYLYVWPERDHLKAYRRTSLNPLHFADATPAISDAVASTNGMPGGFLTLNAEPNGGGVLLASLPLEGGKKAMYRGVLRAFNAIPDANSKLQELWNNVEDDYVFGKFAPST